MTESDDFSSDLGMRNDAELAAAPIWRTRYSAAGME